MGNGIRAWGQTPLPSASLPDSVLSSHSVSSTPATFFSNSTSPVITPQVDCKQDDNAFCVAQ